MKKKDVRGIRHNSPLVFIEIIKRFYIDNNQLELIQKVSGTNEREKIDKAESLLKADKKDLTKMSDQQLDTYIKLLSSLPKLFIDTTKEKLSPIEDIIEMYIPNFDQLLNMAILPMKLYVLSVITFPHWNRSHYPDTSFLSAKDYNLELPLIKKLHELYDITENTLQDLDKLFKAINN